MIDTISRSSCCLFFRSLLPVLQKLVKLGTPKQAKHAIRCIHALYDNRDAIYQQIFEVSQHLFPDRAEVLLFPETLTLI